MLRLLDLPVLEVDRCRPSEHHDRHLDHALLGVNFLDRALEVLERALLDADVLALLEVDGELRLLLVDALDLGPTEFSPYV